MFLLRNGKDYSVYKKMNKDLFTWKQYDLSDALTKNSHDMVEL